MPRYYVVISRTLSKRQRASNLWEWPSELKRRGSFHWYTNTNFLWIQSWRRNKKVPFWYQTNPKWCLLPPHCGVRDSLKSYTPWQFILIPPVFLKGSTSSLSMRSNTRHREFRLNGWFRIALLEKSLHSLGSYAFKGLGGIMLCDRLVAVVKALDTVGTYSK